MIHYLKQLKDLKYIYNVIFNVKNMINSEHLEQIGLPGKQASVYLSLLKNGPQFLQQISKSTGIKRTTLYLIIEKMIERGLIDTEIKQKRKKYFIKDPEHLLSQMRKQNFLMQALMPEIKTLFEEQGAGSKIRVYDTINGLKRTLEEINSLNPQKDELLTIESDIESSLKLGFDFWKKLLAEKKKLGVPSRTILPSGEQDDFVIRDHKIKIKTSNFLKDFKIALYLFSNKSIIIIPADSLCIVIENKKIKNALSSLFEIIWRRSKALK